MLTLKAEGLSGLRFLSISEIMEQIVSIGNSLQKVSRVDGRCIPFLCRLFRTQYATCVSK